MNSFKDLEEQDVKDPPHLPLGIQSNVHNQLTGMRTMGNIVELYLTRILDMLTAMFGGEAESEEKTHLVTLFTSINPDQLTVEPFIRNLTNTLSLSQSPALLVAIAVKAGTEISLKMPAKDAARFTSPNNADLLKELQIEVR